MIAHILPLVLSLVLLFGLLWQAGLVGEIIHLEIEGINFREGTHLDIEGDLSYQLTKINLNLSII